MKFILNPSRLYPPFILIAAAISLAACDSLNDAEVRARLDAYDAAFQELPRRFYEPGLGDLMHALQLRHAKLWFAGSAGNWDLAKFELHEIEENLERIARWHTLSEEGPIGALVKVHMRPGRYALEQSIAQQSVPQFSNAFDRFTEGCNACHRAVKHAFIVILRPTVAPYGNQAWAQQNSGVDSVEVTQ